MFGIGEIEHKFLQCLCIFKRIADSLIETLYMKIIFQIIKVLHKEIKKVFTIIPFTEQDCKFIKIFIIVFYSP